jgi:hypothetical protein
MPLAAGERFARIVAALCLAVAARGGARAAAPVAGALVVAIWGRLRRLAGRFARVLGRPRARARVPARATAPRRVPGRPASRRLAASPPLRLPRRPGWLLRLVPEAAVQAAQLRDLLAEPELAARLASEPGLGRLLRPLFRSLGVDLPGVGLDRARTADRRATPRAAVRHRTTPRALPGGRPSGGAVLGRRPDPIARLARSPPPAG